MLKDKYKLFSIIEGVIIIVLLVGLIISISNNKKDLTDTKDNKGTSDTTKQEVKPYVGIYHIYNYNKTYNEVNITLNEDQTCEFSIYSNKIYNCNYEEIGKDKLNLIISSYVAYQQEPKEGDKVDLSLNWKLSNTLEGCESELKKYHEQSDAYDSYIGCTKATTTTEITLLNNGLLCYNKQFTKIK